MDKTILNLSKYPLTQDQISVLSKGLNFCPTPSNPNPGEFRTDLDSLHRRLRLRARFEDDSEDDDSRFSDNNLLSSDPFFHRKFRQPSSFNPVEPLALEAMILSNEHDFNNRPLFKPNRERNLTPGEFLAIKELQNLNHKIVVKAADKGSAVVVQDRETYLAEAERQLSNPSFYLHVEEDLTEKHRLEIQEYIDQMYSDGELDITVANYLHDAECRTSRLYLLPKIHKGIIPPPGRPIVSANGSPTEKISQLVDHFLQLPSTQNPSYVKDTTHFLQKIGNLGNIPKDSLLVTFDVTALYTNIPNKEGIEAVKIALNSSRPGRVKPSNENLIQLLEFVLTKNNFQFNGEHYLQTGGTSMGTKAAPCFANIYMGLFERKYVYVYHLQPLVWVRFLDDCFCVWQHGKAELDRFLTYLNSCSPTIKFTMEHSTEKITFLDTVVRVNQTKL
jgi:hypothetical protein